MIIFLHGADSFRSRRFLREIKEKFQREVDADAQSISFIDGASASLSAISEKLNTGSLFVKKRLVVIENIFANKKEEIYAELHKYLKKFAAGEDVIVFREEEEEGRKKTTKAGAKKLFDYLAAQPYSQEFKPLLPAQTLSFIKQEAGRYDKQIGQRAAAQLLARTGGDLWVIASEIRKLSFAASGPELTEELIKETVNGLFDENIFGLTDALSARNKKLAIEKLEEQYAAGLSDEYLLSMLTRQFKILLQIRAGLDAGQTIAQISADLKLHPFVAKKGLAQAQNFTAEALRAGLDRLVRLDYQNKTGSSQLRTELALLISGL